MTVSFDYKIDTANSLLICESRGEVTRCRDFEHMLKTIIKLGGKNQLKNVVHDVTALTLSCPLIDITQVMHNMHDYNWLGDLKIARIITEKQNVQNVIETLADKFELPIKNFDNRSEAMVWLLFNRLRGENG
jgi:hypothetical protein